MASREKECETMNEITRNATPADRLSHLRVRLGWALALAGSLAVVYLLYYAGVRRGAALPSSPKKAEPAASAALPAERHAGLSPKARAAAPAAARLKVGD